MPTIFPSTQIQTPKKTTTESPAITTSECENCSNLEREIKFLRECVASFEQENEKGEKRLQTIIDAQLEEILKLREKVNRLEITNAKYQSDFARYAVDDDPRVLLFSYISYHISTVFLHQN